MNEGMYIGIRNYLEEIASQNKQILAELQRMNQAAIAQQTGKPDAFIEAVTQKLPPDAVGKATVETVRTVDVDNGAPWPDYDDLTVGEIVSRGRTQKVDEAMRNRILAYERANKKRNGVITPYVNWNS